MQWRRLQSWHAPCQLVLIVPQTGVSRNPNLGPWSTESIVETLEIFRNILAEQNYFQGLKFHDENIRYDGLLQTCMSCLMMFWVENITLEHWEKKLRRNLTVVHADCAFSLEGRIYVDDGFIDKYCQTLLSILHTCLWAPDRGGHIRLISLELIARSIVWSVLYQPITNIIMCSHNQHKSPASWNISCTFHPSPGPTVAT